MAKKIGMNARDIEKAINYQIENTNVKHICSCPLHLIYDEKKKKYVGQYINGEYFNRSGIKGNPQSMCANGKTLIDRLTQNGFRRFCLKYVTLLDADIFYDFTKESVFKNLAKINQEILINIKNFLEKESKEINLFLEKKDSLSYLIILNFLQQNIKPKKMGIYRTFKESEMNQLIEFFKEINKKDEKAMKNITHKYLDDSFYIKDSTSKDFVNIEDVSYNLSKTQPIYIINESGDIVPLLYNGKHLKAPLHNTIVKGLGNESRVIKNFSFEGEHAKANKKIKELRKDFPSNMYQMDHIIPLALGGTHTPENIEPLEKGKNNQKKAKITFEAYLKAYDNLDCFCSYSIEEFRRFKKEVGKNENLFNKRVVLFEKKLKKAQEERKSRFFKQNREDKIKELSYIYPEKNHFYIENLLERMERKK